MRPGWERVATHHGGTVAGLAMGGAVVFAATAVGVYRSTDGGQTWTLPGVGPSVPFANVVAASPRFVQDHTVFACGADGLYRSSDGGDTWLKVLVGSRMLSVVVAQDAGRDTLTVLAGTETDGILRSEDSGRTWAGANAGLLDLTAICLALSPRFESDRTGFAGTASGLYRTRNGGRSWRSVDTGMEEPAVQCLAVSPHFSDDRLVLAGTEADGLLRSGDGGASWSRPPSLTSGGIAAVAFSARYPAVPTIAAATESGIALSHDGGGTWVPACEGRELVMSLVYTEHELLAGLHQRAIVRSTDGGSTWRPAIEGLSARLDTELLISPEFARDRTLFVAGLEDGVRASTDCGVTWADYADGLEGLAVYGLAVSASNGARGLPVSASDGALYAATSDGIRVRSSHAGSWRPVPAAEGPARLVATGPGVALAVMEGGRLLSLHDGTLLRTPFDGSDVIALAISPGYARDKTIFAATTASAEMTLWRSTDGGERWQGWLVEPAGGVTRMPLELSPAHGTDECVFVALGGRVLRPLRHAREVRAGERRPIWRSSQLPASVPLGTTDLAVSPAFGEDHTVFAATNAGVFVSRDGGETFHPWSKGLAPPRTVAIAVSPAYRDDREVYALGLGGSIWRRVDK